MTIEVFALFPKKAYLVATSNDQEHGLDFADKICKQVGILPHAYIAGTAGELKFKGEKSTLAAMIYEQGVMNK